MMPISSILGGGMSAVEVIHQAFNPAISVLVSPEVDLICGKNRLTFVELLQPFSRLSVEGQIRDVNNIVHPVTHFRLSVRDCNWKPASAVLSRRLLSEAVSYFTAIDTKTVVKGENGEIEVNPFTPWYDSWRETLWSCLELTDHDFTRHYLATLLVVSSSHANPMEQFQQLNNQLQQLIVNAGPDSPRWFNPMVLRYYVLVHDACDGDATKAEEIFQSMKSAYGTHACQLLVINSKPRKSPGSHTDVGLPSPDPWLRFLPRKPNKRPTWKQLDQPSEVETVGETSVPGSVPDLPSKVEEGTGSAFEMKLPLMDALQEAMQEVGILAPSPSTAALSSLADSSATNHQNAAEVPIDPLTGPAAAKESDHSISQVDGPDLSMQSRVSDGAEIHGGCLTTDDVDRIQHFINEFCLKSLLPHMERQMKLLSEAAAARKSTHRSLLSATKRWFGASRPGQQSGPAAVAVSYHPESAQLQVRRLGDLAFLLGHYELAYTSYHTAKKDFEADQAWLHYAGALEMAALSVFLQGPSGRSIPFHYLETALSTYLHTCKMANWATRCAILASECLKNSGQYGEAALHLIRLTSEDADLRSAVLLEQAALCFLRSAIRSPSVQASGKGSIPHIRKYGFHMILAGHRFGKSGQKRHASRAYQLALQVYRGHGWSLAEDHIHYTVGRQCLSGQQIEAACSALGALLKPHSMQTPTQQTAYLTEFIHVHQMLSRQAGSATGSDPSARHLPVLPLPLIDGRQIQTLVETRDPAAGSPSPGVAEASHVTFGDDEAHHPRWGQLEEKLVQAVQGSVPMTFRPTNVLFNASTTNTQRPASHCNELISLEVPLENPLHIGLLLSELRLLWIFQGADGKLSNAHPLTKSQDQNASQLLVTTYTIPRLLLNPNSLQKVILHIRPKVEGLLTILGIGFELGSSKNDAAGGGPSVAGQVLFDVRGPRLNSTPAERQGKVYAPDKRLEIQIGPAMPKLNVKFHQLPEFLLSGEIRQVRMELVNIHPHIPVSQIVVASSDPQHVVVDLPRVTVNAKYRDDQIALYAWDVTKKSANLWLRGSEKAGLSPFDLIFYYANPAVKSSYRLLRHSSKVFVSSSLTLNVWEQLVPSAACRKSGETSKETLALQLEIRNLRDVDDTSLSGIRIRQISLISREWKLQKDDSLASSEAILDPQESMIHSTRATRDVRASSDLISESISLSGPSKDLMAVPYRNLISEFQNSTTRSTIVVAWSANQVSDDGHGTTVIEGQHYFSLKQSSVSKPGQQLATYTMDYPTRVTHNFDKSRICVVPVLLHLHNSTQSPIIVRYLANSNSGKSSGAPTQLYMPEAATPFLWIGRVQGEAILSAERQTDTVKLAIAVSRPGAYSLARGLQITMELVGSDSVLESPKLEFTLVVENEIY